MIDSTGNIRDSSWGFANMISKEPLPVWGCHHWDGKPTGGPGGQLRWHDIRTIDTHMFVQYPNIHQEPNPKYKQLEHVSRPER